MDGVAQIRSAFATYGMFIIDKIVEADGTVLEDVIGGAGTFAAVGARMFSPACKTSLSQQQIGIDSAPPTTGYTSFVVDYGSDAPPQIVSQLRSLGLDLLERHDRSRLCTRGLNTYDPTLGVRNFEYTTPKIRITPTDLPRRMQRALSVHCVCSPGRLLAILRELDGLVGEQDRADRVVVWEPIPDCCFRSRDEQPTQDGSDPWLDEYRSAAGRCTVVSPNAHELSGLADAPPVAETDPAFQQRIEELGRLVSARLDTSIMVVRCGAQGSCLVANSTVSWSPAFLQSSDAVVDPTGAGNTFCGALARLIDRERLRDVSHLEEACRRANVAAGLACMQVGLPVLSLSPAGTELWNGRSIAEHMQRYLSND